MNCLLGVSENNIVNDCNKGYISPPVTKCDHLALLKKNFLSEFVTKEEKLRVLRNLGLYDEAISWGQIGGYIENLTDLWNKISFIINDLETKITKELEGKQATTQIKYQNDAYPNINTLLDALDQILYQDLSILMWCTPSVKEVGETVKSIIFTWKYNKPNIKSQEFDGEKIDPDIRELVLEGNFTSTTTKTLVASDGTKTYTTSATLNFYPGIYYGSSSADSFLILNLDRILQSSRRATVTVDGTNDKQVYIYICIPYSYGTPTFTVSGFSGGFELVDDNLLLDKYKTGNSIRYSVYRSDNGGLGVTTINIS